MPAAIPVIAGAVASYAGASMLVAAAVGAVAGGVLAAAKGENILKGALMGGLGGLAGGAMVGAVGFAGAGAAEAGATVAAEGAANVAPAVIESASSAAPQIASEGMINGWSLAETTPIADATSAASQSAVSTVAEQGGGLLQTPATGGLNAATANMSIDPTMSNSTDLLSRLTRTGSTGTTIAPSAEPGLLDSFQTWAEKHPTLTMGGIQTVGNGLAGMSAASTAEEQLAYRRAQDELRRRNASYAKVPVTTWK